MFLMDASIFVLWKWSRKNDYLKISIPHPVNCCAIIFLLRVVVHICSGMAKWQQIWSHCMSQLYQNYWVDGELVFSCLLAWLPINYELRVIYRHSYSRIFHRTHRILYINARWIDCNIKCRYNRKCWLMIHVIVLHFFCTWRPVILK